MNRKGYIGLFVLTLYASCSFGQLIIDTICGEQLEPSYLAVRHQPHHIYYWSVSGGTILSRRDSSAILIDWNTASPGLHNVWVTSINRKTECPSDTSRGQVLIVSPQKTYAKSPIEVCYGDWVKLESPISGDFQWENGSTERYFEFEGKEDSTVSLISFNAGCFNDTLEFLVKVYDKPQARIIDIPDTMSRYTDLELWYSGNSQVVQITWYLNGFKIGAGRNATVTFDEYGYYDIAQVVQNQYCSDTVWKSVYVKDIYTAFFPNSFTPNNDGVNDYWFFNGLGHDYFEAGIYTRWGEVVYSWTSQDGVPGWDGFKNGQPAMQDSYVYKVFITDTKGEVHDYVGYFLLIR